MLPHTIALSFTRSLVPSFSIVPVLIWVMGELNPYCNWLTAICNQTVTHDLEYSMNPTFGFLGRGKKPKFNTTKKSQTTDSTRERENLKAKKPPNKCRVNPLSFLYSGKWSQSMMKSRGSSTKPWGTPEVTGEASDEKDLSWMNWASFSGAWRQRQKTKCDGFILWYSQNWALTHYANVMHDKTGSPTTSMKLDGYSTS